MSGARLFNRELSLLDFGGRILDIAEDERVPLLERLRFISIFSELLDEFFQVRVAGLKDQVEAGLKAASPDGLSASEQLGEIRLRVLDLVKRQEHILLSQLFPALSANGIKFCSWTELEEEDRSYLVQEFSNTMHPVLTPLAVDPAHPFPYISNLSLNLGVLVRDPEHPAISRFARLKVPPLLPRFVPLPDGQRFVPVEQVIASQLPSLFPGMEVAAHCVFRVTRNADLTLDEDEADDLLEAVEMELRRRRFGKAVRLEIESSAPREVLDLLSDELELKEDDVYFTEAPIDLTGLSSIASQNRPDLHHRPLPAVVPKRFVAGSDLFAVIRERDVLVHHPYESFTATVQSLVEAAASDPHVLAIKQTLYRTSWDSPVVRALARAAENGKQVAAVVELKARFDEAANIGWARLLERAGAHVTYGLVGLKTHCKCLLIVREEGGKIVRYCHIGTGNYNSDTARSYEDLGIMTCDKEIAEDLTDLFNLLTGFAKPRTYRSIIVSPGYMREALCSHIRRQAELGAEGEIFIKVNNLTDPRAIEQLYQASQAGTRIRLVVRSICSLRPGVRGLSENITVKSIVGRFLEHARIFRFGPAGDPDTTYLIGSADLMERNLDRRVEVLVPVRARELRSELDEIIGLNLEDSRNSWILEATGSWRRLGGGDGIDLHEELSLRAQQQARVVASV